VAGGEDDVEDDVEDQLEDKLVIGRSKDDVSTDMRNPSPSNVYRPAPAVAY
jgi:hypothetical protein